MKLCECGCGGPAPIAKADYRRLGHVKGEPVRFISGHNARGKRKSAETRAKMSAYHSDRPASHRANLSEAGRNRPLAPNVLASTIHAWLNRRHPKAGHCEDCGKEGKTDYAFLRHPEPHTRDREDYRELCRSCHTILDMDSGFRPGRARKWWGCELSGGRNYDEDEAA